MVTLIEKGPGCGQAHGRSLLRDSTLVDIGNYMSIITYGIILILDMEGPSVGDARKMVVEFTVTIDKHVDCTITYIYQLMKYRPS
jgi:hypothetical protein